MEGCSGEGYVSWGHDGPGGVFFIHRVDLIVRGFRMCLTAIVVNKTPFCMKPQDRAEVQLIQVDVIL
jgi:hypothetical protein